MNPVALIVRREIVEKLRSKLFRVLNVILLVIVFAVTVLPTLIGGDDEPTPIVVATVGTNASAIVAVADNQSVAFDVTLSELLVADEAAAIAALETEEADLALVGSDQLISVEAPTARLVALLDGARQLALLDGALADAGLDQAARIELLAPAPLAITTLEEADDGPDDAALALGLVIGTMLYGLLIFYGQQVAQGIVQEKQSRVMEVLLAAVQPVQLLGGKLLGLGLLGLGQVVSLAGVAYVGFLVTDRGAIPPEAVPTLIASVLWFILGYSLYATLFALAAAAVAKVEDLQTAMIGPIIVLVASFFLTQVALATPDSVLATVAALLPTTAPIYQPLAVALGTATVLHTVIAVAGVVATTAVLVPLAARVHAGAALSVRQRLSLREAARRARA